MAEDGEDIIPGAALPPSLERPHWVPMATTTTTTVATKTRTADGSAQINMGINISID
jgi:hypothetical protein